MASTVDTTATAGGRRDLAPPVADHADDPDHADHVRRRHHGVVVAVVVGAIVRFGWLAYARPEPVSDFRHYLRLAISLLDTGMFGVGHPSAWRLPAYPLVLAAGAAVDRDPLALSALTATISVAQVGLTYLVAWRIFRRRSSAIVAAMTAAIAPAFVTFAPVLASEHLLAVFVLAAVGTALRSRPNRWWIAAALTGVLTGAAILTRGEALAYLPVIALVVGLERAAARHGRRRSLATAATTLVAAALVVAPWVVRNERVVGHGAGLTTTGGFNFYLAHSPGGYGWRTPLPLPLRITDELTRDEVGWRYGLRYARRHPAHWWPTVRHGTHELLAPSTYAASYATVRHDTDLGRVVARDDLGLRATAIDLAGRSSRWLLWLGAIGLAAVGVWRRTGLLAVGGIAAANWVLYAVVFWAQARYRFVVDALACVAVGALPAAAAALVHRARSGAGSPRQLVHALFTSR